MTKPRVWSFILLNPGLETKFSRSEKSEKFGKTEASDFLQKAQTISLGERAGKDTNKRPGLVERSWNTESF